MCVCVCVCVCHALSQTTNFRLVQIESFCRIKKVNSFSQSEVVLYSNLQNL